MKVAIVTPNPKTAQMVVDELGSDAMVFDSAYPEQLRGYRFDRVVVEEIVKTHELQDTLEKVKAPIGEQ